MTPAEVLASLAEHSVVVEGTPGGHIDLVGLDTVLDPALVQWCRRYRWLWDLGLGGLATGRTWLVCATCDELHYGKPEDPRTCSMTPGCGGVVVRAEGPRVVQKDLGPLHGCARCQQPSRRLVATYWTHHSEAICPTCVNAVVTDFDANGWPEIPEQLGRGAPRNHHCVGTLDRRQLSPHTKGAFWLTTSSNIPTRHGISESL